MFKFINAVLVEPSALKILRGSTISVVVKGIEKDVEAMVERILVIKLGKMAR